MAVCQTAQHAKDHRSSRGFTKLLSAFQIRVHRFLIGVLVHKPVVFSRLVRLEQAHNMRAGVHQSMPGFGLRNRW